MTMRTRTLLLMVFAAVGAGACSDALETPASPTVTPPGFTFSTNFASQGSASRSFVTAGAGAVTATLTAATPAVPLGIGIGIPRGDGGGCSLTASVEAQPATTPQLTIAVDAGAFCIKVFDVGYVRDEVTLSLTVTHP